MPRLYDSNYMTSGKGKTIETIKKHKNKNSGCQREGAKGVICEAQGIFKC